MERDAEQAEGVGPEEEAVSILRAVTSEDFERLEPPAGIWGRIESAVGPGGPGSPKEPPGHLPGAGTVVEYRIDANDVVVGVGNDWVEFASQSHAPELAELDQDRTLWSYFDGEEVKDLWRSLVERVRSAGQLARVPLRCDSPDHRRWFEMTVMPESDGWVHFRCVLTFEEARTPVALLDPNGDRDSTLEPVALCGWCGQAMHGSVWLDIEDFLRATRLLEQDSLPPVANGICSSCRSDMAAELLVADSGG